MVIRCSITGQRTHGNAMLRCNIANFDWLEKPRPSQALGLAFIIECGDWGSCHGAGGDECLINDWLWLFSHGISLEEQYIANIQLEVWSGKFGLTNAKLCLWSTNPTNHPCSMCKGHDADAILAP